MIKGFTAGSFDLLHAGHSMFLETCEDNCEELTIGLHIDPSIENKLKNKPIQSVFERYMQLRAYSTDIIPYETEEELRYILEFFDFNKYFVGDDHALHEVTGQDICDDYNIEIVFIPRFHKYSSSELRNRIIHE